ncbi:MULTISPECIES: recombination regulator RecX [Paraburkholderia]|uniref:Regulatory protein RecX n=1 Tax=Paraburkholderia hospita TaxID=169430 RepID=A0AAN1MHJ6_9BURK|nr:recombination regulator RecX [Paraburkholderia hospita]AUT67331.1 recombination regulator RecX [Paraburkholderia hospita]SEI08040.1 regulatory protein [Paraburkholderia hospita]
MIRKGRSASSTTGAGRSAGGPRDDDAFESSSRLSSSPSASTAASFSNDSSSDNFDPFESFDAHDRAAGLGAASRDRPDADASSEEVTYTRSRRQPGEGKPADTASRASQRPTRSLKGRALGYLSRREYSRAELSRKLSPYAEEGESIDALLDSLESEGWLSDSRFAESLLNRRASRMGAGRIVNELKRHSVGQELVEEVSAQLRETELARAQAVWRKKFGALPETPNERAKQARFLATRGFSQGIIGKILKGIDED